MGPYLETEAAATAKFHDAFAVLLATQGEPCGEASGPARVSLGMMELRAAREAFAALPSPILCGGALANITASVSPETFARRCVDRGHDPVASFADLRAGRTLRIGARDYWIEAARAVQFEADGAADSETAGASVPAEASQGVA